MPHPLDSVHYPDGVSLTGPERQEWESRKYGAKIASVLRLTSGRFAIAEQGHRLVAVVDSAVALTLELERISTLSEPEYTPPRSRAAVKLDIDEGELFDLLKDL